MAEPFLSEIRIFSFNFPPKGWAFCNGQLLPINQNQALFSLLGTTYGGNGQTNFALPNLQGQVPIHTGNGHTLGERAGSSAVTITQQQMPQHIHFLQASTAAAGTNIPDNTTAVGETAPNDLYTGAAGLVTMAPGTVSNVGGSQPHNNMMPYLVLNFCIALQGIFPSPN
ncbi:MAG TPA: tail fiber protein [Pyrinomonadaceae bacterium]